MFFLAMYSYITSWVKANAGVFKCKLGTRQGDTSSTTISSLFNNQLCTRLSEGNNNGIFVTDCADTLVNLQKQLNIIYQFCIDTGMEINLVKIEIIVFRNGGPLRNNEKMFFR